MSQKPGQPHALPPGAADRIGASPWQHAAILALFIAVTFANSLNNGFTLDSATVVKEDHRIKSATWPHAWQILSENYWWPAQNSDLYRPLTTFSYMFNYVLTGPDTGPMPFRLTNLFIHYINTLLLAALARRIIGPRSALFIAAVFAVHPLSVESVTNLVGRADLLSVMAILIGVHSHLRWRQSGRHRWLALLGIAAFIAAFSKESGVVLIAVIAAWDWLFHGDGRSEEHSIFDPRPFWQRFKHGGWISYTAIAPTWAIFFVSRRIVLNNTPVFSQAAVDNPLVLLDGWSRALMAMSIQGRYVGLFFWPRWLSCDYSFNQIPLWTGSAGDPNQIAILLWIGLAMLAGAVALAVGAARRGVLFIAAMGGLIMLPTSNLLMPVGTILAERFMYLPSAGLAAILAALAGIWIQRRNQTVMVLAFWIAAAVVIALFSFRTIQRNRDWQDDVRIWTSAKEVCPDSFKVHQGVATSLQTRDGLERVVDTMIDQMLQAKRIIESPELPDIFRTPNVYSILGQCYGHKGDEASRAAGYKPPMPNPAGQPWYLKALEMTRQGLAVDKLNAIASRKARLDRGIPPGRVYEVGNFNIQSIHAILCMRAGFTEEAVSTVEYARKVKPGDTQSHSLAAEIYEQQGNLEMAIVRAFEAAILGGDDSSRAMIQRVYTRIKLDPPALVPTASGGVELNLRHPVVSRHLDIALRDLIRIFLESDLKWLADLVMNVADKTYGRPPSTYQDLIDAYIEAGKPAKPGTN